MVGGGLEGLTARALGKIKTTLYSTHFASLDRLEKCTPPGSRPVKTGQNAETHLSPNPRHHLQRDGSPDQNHDTACIRLHVQLATVPVVRMVLCFFHQLTYDCSSNPESREGPESKYKHGQSTPGVHPVGHSSHPAERPRLGSWPTS